MPTGDEYRAKAAEILALVKVEDNPRTVAAYQTLAQSYLRLAELADRKKPDLVYETPVPLADEPIIMKPAESPIAVPPEIAKEQIDAAKEATDREPKRNLYAADIQRVGNTTMMTTPSTLRQPSGRNGRIGDAP
jgi:hypothetical protein